MGFGLAGGLISRFLPQGGWGGASYGPDYFSPVGGGTPLRIGDANAPFQQNATYTPGPGLFSRIGQGLAGLFSNGMPGMPPVAPAAPAAGQPTMPTNSQTNRPPMFAAQPRPNVSGTSLLSSPARNALGLGTSGFAGGYAGSQFGGDRAFFDSVAAHTQK
jgi:hypothetical protein